MKNKSKQPTEAVSADSSERYRPLGLTAAILSTAIGYGLLPLTSLLLVAWSALSRRGIGVELANTPRTYVDVSLGVIVLMACVMAWIGRPRGVRMALLVLVWLSTLLQIYYAVGSPLAPATASDELIGGNFDVSRVLICQMPFLLAIATYVTWYLNRAPARQFYAQRQRNQKVI
jgi:hypothetical protein